MRGCAECDQHIKDRGMALVGACASAGIERGLGTAEMFAVYIAGVHKSHTTKEQP